jgi:hypothetical protein
MPIPCDHRPEAEGAGGKRGNWTRRLTAGSGLFLGTGRTPANRTSLRGKHPILLGLGALKGPRVRIFMQALRPYVNPPAKLIRLRSCFWVHCSKQALAWSFWGTLLHVSGRLSGKLPPLAGLAMVLCAFSALASTPNFVQCNSAQTIDVGNKTAATIAISLSGSTYFFVVAAYNTAGVERPFSNEVSMKAP